MSLFYQNNLPWKNFPIVSRLKDYFSIENIVIDNDVYMATFAEWKVSNLNTEDTFVYLTVSTGISCSIIHGGSFIRGNGFAGEIGLFPVLSKKSANGMKSLEKVASGPAIQKRVEKLFANQSLTTKDLFVRYKDDDEDAIMLMKEVVEFYSTWYLFNYMFVGPTPNCSRRRRY